MFEGEVEDCADCDGGCVCAREQVDDCAAMSAIVFGRRVCRGSSDAQVFLRGHETADRGYKRLGFDLRR